MKRMLSNRRRLLQGLSGMLVLAGLRPLALRADTCLLSLDALRSCVADEAHAAAIGDLWLRAQSAAIGIDVLMREISTALRAATLHCDARALQRKIVDDYRNGDAEWVGDWWLSRTEARVYAVIALVSAAPTAPGGDRR